jgi:signal transduction histidine kinase
VARYFHLKDLPIGGERFECIGRKRDGAEFPIEVSLSFLDDGGRPCFSAAIRDITEQREREGALRRLSGRLLQIQDDERRRIAREVHDSLGQYLAAAKMHLQALDQERPQSGNARSSGSPGFDSQDRGGPTIQECIEILDKAITEVRTVSYLLYPPMLDEVGLQSAISGYVEGFAKRSGIATDLEIDPDLGRLPREVELSLFRVLQECLTNIHRHSGSQTARVKLATDGANTVLEIRDDGKGMPDGSLEKFHKDLGTTLGVGLRGMSARMHQLGGKLELFSDAKGTAIIATVPAA